MTFTPEQDSVVLAFMFRKWGDPWAPDRLLASGKKRNVDSQLAPYASLSPKSGTNPWWHIGKGVYVEDYRGALIAAGAEFYRDKTGVRLIALEGPEFACDTIILSCVSRHQAKLVRRDFAGLRTESGIGLGDSAQRVRKLLGAPSRQDRFSSYEILWYLGKPRHVILPDPPPFDEGEDAAYALRKGRVVEIWLHVWGTLPVG